MRHHRYCIMRLKFLTIVGASLVVALSYCGPLRAAEPTAAGLWEQLDDYGHSWFLFFERDGVYEGAVVKMFIRPRDPPNPICNGCAGDQKNQPVLGLVLIKGMKRNGLNYDKGTITDPRNGSVYQAKMKVSPDGKLLTVRGFLGIDLFGQDQIWKRLPDDALPMNEIPPAIVQYLSTPPDNKRMNGGNGPKNPGLKTTTPNR